MWNSDQEQSQSLFMVSTINAWGKKLATSSLSWLAEPFIDDNPKDAAVCDARIHERKSETMRNEYFRKFWVQRLTWSSGNFVDAGEPAKPVMDSKMMNKLMKESGHARQPHSVL